MPRIALHCSHEQIPPAACSRGAAAPRRPASTARMSSDHFSPWSERQGESGFAWSWLGAALEPPRCPSGWSTRPASATTRRSSPRPRPRSRRCTRAASGSRSAPARPRTSTSPAAWPPKAVRNARLLECVEVMRALFAGEEVTHDGRVSVDRARLYTRPPSRRRYRRRGERRDRRLGGRLGRRADHGQPAADRLRRMIDAFRSGGGEGKAVPPGAPLLAPRRRGGPRIAHDQWRTNVFDPPIRWDLEPAEQFDETRPLRAARGPARERCSSPPTSSSTSPGCAS